MSETKDKKPAPKPVKQRYFLPELGKTVEASSLAEAIKKAKEEGNGE
jgi:hypothetical protein